MKPPEWEELIPELFAGELTAAEIRQLREALETRWAQQAEEVAEGLADPHSPEVCRRRETLRAQLEALREEEHIARFVEESLRAWLAQEELWRQLEE